MWAMCTGNDVSHIRAMLVTSERAAREGEGHISRSPEPHCLQVRALRMLGVLGSRGRLGVLGVTSSDEMKTRFYCKNGERAGG